MGIKLNKSTYPSGHGPNDMKCYGPPALKDGDFDHCKIADLGCFNQQGVDSNKFYYAAVCQSRKNNNWYVYFEWGRTGATNNAYQFVECSDESDAQEEFADQLHSKNDKRGQWVTIAGVKTLQAKPGKDCYLVRPMATRSVGLPDGKTISFNDGAKAKSIPVVASKTTKPARTVDNETISLMRDLNVATVQYARTSVVGGALPMQSAIDEARLFLAEAQKRVGKLGSATIDQQVQDTELRNITSLVYSRIPKIKPIGAADETWILSANNIAAWHLDLDSFEQALYTSIHVSTASVQDPFDGMQIDMEHVAQSSDLGRFLYGWWPRATARKHSYLGSMKIRNAWKLERHDDRGKVEKTQKTILADKPVIRDRPTFQPSERNDLVLHGLSGDAIDLYKKTNTSLLFHGSRSVNISSILRTGLRFPQELVGVVISGSLLGPGSYFASDWGKSAGYCSVSGGYYTSGSGAVKGRGAFMFAGDVILGAPYVAPYPHGYTSPPKGFHSVFGKAGHTGHLANDEWVIYRKEQVKLMYLVEFEA